MVSRRVCFRLVDLWGRLEARRDAVKKSAHICLHGGQFSPTPDNEEMLFRMTMSVLSYCSSVQRRSSRCISVSCVVRKKLGNVRESNVGHCRIIGFPPGSTGYGPRCLVPLMISIRQIHARCCTWKHSARSAYFSWSPQPRCSWIHLHALHCRDAARPYRLLRRSIWSLLVFYRRVRNPMYIGVLVTIVGMGLQLGEARIFAYAVFGRPDVRDLRARLRGAETAAHIRRAIRPVLRKCPTLGPALAAMARRRSAWQQCALKQRGKTLKVRDVRERNRS